MNQAVVQMMQFYQKELRETPEGQEALTALGIADKKGAALDGALCSLRVAWHAAAGGGSTRRRVEL